MMKKSMIIMSSLPKFLEKNGVTATRSRDCVFSQPYPDRRTTNQMISGRSAIAQYLADIRNTPVFPLDAVLTSHCLPTGPDAPLWTDD